MTHPLKLTQTANCQQKQSPMTGKTMFLQKKHQHASLQTSASLINNTARVASD
jgi:hypothetical protein